MNRAQTFHERLIPLLVEGLGCNSYLELGTHINETIGNVLCEKKYGVDKLTVPCSGAVMFQMTTDNFIQHYASKYAPFDFVFIDADHSADSVESDFSGIWPYVSDEGIVCMHDTNPDTVEDTQPGFCGDAWRFIQKLTGDGNNEMLTLPYHPGLTLVRKRVNWGPR